MTPDYLAIGHITKDVLPGGGFAPGGTVTFAARAARKLGAEVAIVTAAPPDLLQLPLFHDIQIYSLPTETATIFENIYRPEGRIQYVRAVAPPIPTEAVPREWYASPIVHLGPVAQECTPELLDLFPGALIGVTPQGFLRDWSGPSGQVRPIAWVGAAAILPRISALILSEEDLPPGEKGRKMLQEFVRRCPLVACTQGKNGCVIYQHGQNQHVPAYSAHELDPTGAGDVFAAAFLLQLRASADPIAAACFANAAAACSIEKPGATGLPDLLEVTKRMQGLK